VKHRISVEWIRLLQESRAIINSFDLHNIEFTENGKVIDIPKRVIDDFKFTGLSNIDFIATDCYKEESK
jgi:hypothetical protein